MDFLKYCFSECVTCRNTDGGRLLIVFSLGKKVSSYKACFRCFICHNANFTRSCDHIKDRKSTRLNSSHVAISYAVFCLKKKKSKDKHTGDIATEDTVYGYTIQ